MSFFRLTMIVPLTGQAAANAAAKADFRDDPRGTTLNTFSVELSPTGLPPATHYISCWGGLLATDFARLRASIGGIPGASIVVTPNDLSTPTGAERSPEQLMASLGLRPVVTDPLP